MLSLSASEKRSKCLGLVGPNRELTTSNPILSVPKKSCIAFRTALLTQLYPDGWSGKGGVVSGGLVAVDGSNSDFQFGSAVVAGFPSDAASWIASIGRQKFQ
jgi:hypothetical protein